MAGLHERFMREPGPTDVLSFPLDDDDVDEHGVRVLGDVVIAPAVAAGNNRDDPEGSCDCWWCTGCCTCWATTTSPTPIGPRCGHGRSATAG